MQLISSFNKILLQIVWCKYTGMAGATLKIQPYSNLLGGGTAPLSPFQPSLASSRSLPLLLMLTLSSCDQGITPPWIPQHRFSATMFSS